MDTMPPLYSPYSDSKNDPSNVFYHPGAGPGTHAAVNASLSGLLESGTVSQSLSFTA